MAVVIHEFEVVAEKPAKEETAGPLSEPVAPPLPSTPHDIERILQRLSDRLARVHAC